MRSVLIVDDQALYRTAISRAVEQGGYTVVGRAGDGRSALQHIRNVRPDAVTLDLEMPILDGLGVLADIATWPRSVPRPKIIVFSAQGGGGATSTIAALSKGADDFVLKPTAAEGADAIATRLLPRLDALFRSAASAPAPTTRAVTSDRSKRRQILLIASSTGGPAALEKALRPMPALAVPVIIVQHMPALFTQTLAEHLDRVGAMRVREVAHGETLRPGIAYIVPGDWHLSLAGTPELPVAQLHQGERVFNLRPAADITFRSAAELYGGAVLAAVFTGMGCDGADGCHALRERGAEILTQRAETCVVSGMPDSVDQRGVTSEHFSPEDFAALVTAYRLG